MTSPLHLTLTHYEGPLDLLLDLIRRQQVQIADIPIATITAQYLEYMKQAEELDIELSADFVYMAATLIHLKSRMLLPKDPTLAEIEADEDPQQELVDRLVQHERFKVAAEMLQQKRLIEEAVWSNPQIKLFVEEEESPDLAVSLFDLVKTLQTVIERVKIRPNYEISKESVSVPEMIQYLRSLLSADDAPRALSATKLFEEQRSRRGMICLFLAILELVKRQALTLVQGEAFGDIGLQKHARFDEVLAAGTNVETLAEEYQ